MGTTSRDYADMVDPYVRAEREAYQRGVRDGLVYAACFVIFVCFVAATLP